MHLTKIRVLQAALSNIKRDKIASQLRGKALVEFRHDDYRHLRKSYGIPEDTCTPKQLYERMHDGSQLELKRCVSVSRYYSMLMEDTPGFVLNEANNLDPAIKRSKSEKSRSRQQDSRTYSRSRSREESKPTSILGRGKPQKDEVSRSVPEKISFKPEASASKAWRCGSNDNVLSKAEKETIAELERKILLV